MLAAAFSERRRNRLPVGARPRGRIVVDATMQSRSHPRAWAIGDCAAIPGPDGRSYPALAQHANREARGVARNVAAVAAGARHSLFVYRSLGTMASLGHTSAVAQVMGVRLTGFPAWWIRRNVLPVPDATLGSSAADGPGLDGSAVLPAGHHAG